MRPPPRWKVSPGAEDLAAVVPADEHRLHRLGHGEGLAIHLGLLDLEIGPRPCAIGWLRLITQTRSFSPASRHCSEQGVPMSFLKIFEKWPEWRTIRPMPCQTRSATRSTIASATSPWALWPHQVSTSVSREPLLGQAVLGLVERRGRRLDAGILVERLGDRAVHALGIDAAHGLVLPVVDVLAPDRHANCHRSNLRLPGLFGEAPHNIQSALEMHLGLGRFLGRDGRGGAPQL